MSTHPSGTANALLLVDDDMLVVNTLKLHLRRIVPPGWAILIALSGEEALAVAREYVTEGGQIPLALIDYQMYPMRGSELLLLLSEQHPGIRTIMLTGQADMEALSVVLDKASLYRFMQKPWDPQELARTVLAAIADGV